MLAVVARRKTQWLTRFQPGPFLPFAAGRAGLLLRALGVSPSLDFIPMVMYVPTTYTR